jgi:hypothetical protein
MLSRFKLRHLLCALPTVVAALVVACSGSPSAPTATVPSATPAAPAVPPAPATAGALSVGITDSPFSDAKALLITFSEVSVHTSGGDWVTLPFVGGATTRTCDLKQLEGPEDVLGTGELAAGHYTQLRLTVSSAKIYFKEATTGAACAPTIVISDTLEVGKSVDVPSGTVKLVREFDVTGSTTTKILLDFDGDKSVLQTGNGAYKMQPVIKVVSVQ